MSAKVSDIQVIVVGAGPAGLVATNLLGQQNIRTLLIERNPGLSQIPKALMVDDEFFRLLETLGLASQVRPNSVGPVTYESYSPFGLRLARVEGRITEHGYPTRSAIYQPEFEQVLLDGVRRFKSVDIRFGHELVKFVDDGERVHAELKRLDGSVERISASYMLAADGSHSIVRKSLGLSFDELVPFGLRHIVVDVAGEGNSSATALMHLGWRRNGSSLPSPHGGRRYEFSLLPGESDEALLRELALAGLFRKFGFPVPQNIIRKTAYTFHARLASRMQSGRVSLLGDAAHVMPVFGSQGMNSGARDANNIVWKIAAVLRGKAGAALPETYDTERREQVAHTIRAATAAGKWQDVGILPLQFLRHVAYVVISLLPPVRRYFANLRYIPKPFIREGFVFSSSDPAAVSLVGQVLPNPLVHDGKAERLLDEVIGSGFALLGIGSGVDATTTGLEHPAWRFLDTRTVIVASDQAVSQAADRPVVHLRDDRFNAVVSGFANQWVLIRPDRIVAAAVSSADLDRLAAEVLERFGTAPISVVEAAE